MFENYKRLHAVERLPACTHNASKWDVKFSKNTDAQVPPHPRATELEFSGDRE